MTAQNSFFSHVLLSLMALSRMPNDRIEKALQQLGAAHAPYELEWCILVFENFIFYKPIQIFWDFIQKF